VQPVRRATRFGLDSESTFPTAAVPSTYRVLVREETGVLAAINKRIAGNLHAKSMIMACRMSTKAWLDP
jgi:hypothetical protein